MAYALGLLGLLIFWAYFLSILKVGSRFDAQFEVSADATSKALAAPTSTGERQSRNV